MQVSNAELTNSLNNCNCTDKKSFNDSTSPSVINESLNINGQPSSKNDVIYARRSSVSGTNKYYIMVNLYNEPYRPDDKIYHQESKRRAKAECLLIYRLVECDKKTYEQYSRYLRNRSMGSYPKNFI